MNSNNIKTSQRETLIVFDWDDVLFPRTALETPPTNLIRMDKALGRIKLSNIDDDKLRVEIRILESHVSMIFMKAVTMGTVKIVSHPSKKWVLTSCQRYMPSLAQLLQNEKIEIISAWDECKHLKTIDPCHYKSIIFNRLAVQGNNNSFTQVVSIGRGKFEDLALKRLEEKFPKDRIKLVKFKSKPKYFELLEQLNIITECLKDIIESDVHVRMIAKQ